MSRNEGIGIAFTGLGKACNTAKLPQTGKIRLPTGQNLMDLRLMTNVKDQAVDLRIKRGLDGHGQFHNAKI